VGAGRDGRGLPQHPLLGPGSARPRAHPARRLGIEPFACLPPALTAACATGRARKACHRPMVPPGGGIVYRPKARGCLRVRATQAGRLAARTCADAPGPLGARAQTPRRGDTPRLYHRLSSFTDVPNPYSPPPIDRPLVLPDFVPSVPESALQARHQGHLGATNDRATARLDRAAARRDGGPRRRVDGRCARSVGSCDRRAGGAVFSF